MDLPRIAAIVVNWNRCADSLRCLASLSASENVDLDVVLVDNASTDDSVAEVRANYPDVEIIRCGSNLGFAEGNNVALRALLLREYDYFFLLNNDATVGPRTVERLLKPMQLERSIGIAGGAVCYMDRPEIIWSAGGTIDRQSGDVRSDHEGAQVHNLPVQPWQVDHITGCAMLVRTDAVNRAGVFDSRFFMYYEETEWCTRVARAGYKIVVVPNALIWHAIDPRKQEGSPAIAYYMTRNHLLFLRASHATTGAWIRTLCRQVRTIAGLFVLPGSVARMRGRVPMLRAMRDFALGRFGPAPTR